MGANLLLTYKFHIYIKLFVYNLNIMDHCHGLSSYRIRRYCFGLYRYQTLQAYKRHRVILGNVFEGRECVLYITKYNTYFPKDNCKNMYLDAVLRYSCANDDLRYGVICLHSLLTSSISDSPFTIGSQYFGKLSCACNIHCHIIMQFSI